MTRAGNFAASPFGARQKSLDGWFGDQSVLVITQLQQPPAITWSGDAGGLVNCYMIGNPVLVGLDDYGSTYVYITCIQMQFVDPTARAGGIISGATNVPNIGLNFDQVNLRGFRVIIVQTSPYNYQNPPAIPDLTALFGNSAFTAKLKRWLLAGGRLVVNGGANIYPADALCTYTSTTCRGGGSVSTPMAVDISFATKVLMNSWLGSLGSSMQLGGGVYAAMTAGPQTGECPPTDYLGYWFDLACYKAAGYFADFGTTETSSFPVYYNSTCFGNIYNNASPYWPNSLVETQTTGPITIAITAVPCIAVNGVAGLLQPNALFSCRSANVYLGNGQAMYNSRYPAFKCTGCSGYPYDPTVLCPTDQSFDLNDRTEPDNLCIMGVERIGNGFIILSGGPAIYTDNIGGQTSPPTTPPSYDPGYSLKRTLTNQQLFYNLFTASQKDMIEAYG